MFSNEFIRVLFWLISLHTFIIALLDQILLVKYETFVFFFFCNSQPSEYDTYADIEAVYECLQTEYGISQEDLILYGQSVGSGPTLHLAAQLPRLRGVVLHSAILSGLRVLCHVKFTLCCDIYKVSTFIFFENSWLDLAPSDPVWLFTGDIEWHFWRLDFL